MALDLVQHGLRDEARVEGPSLTSFKSLKVAAEVHLLSVAVNALARSPPSLRSALSRNSLGRRLPGHVPLPLPRFSPRVLPRNAEQSGGMEGVKVKLRDEKLPQELLIDSLVL